MSNRSERDGLTRKRRKVVADVIAGINPTHSVRKHYDTAHPAKIAHKVMKDPAVKENIQQALIKAGFTSDERAKKLKELHNAVKYGTEPDWKVQLETEKHVSDLMGDKAPNKNINVNVSEKTFLEDLKKKAQDT